MPKEYTALLQIPEPLHTCPNCGAHPFESFMRGSVQRAKRSWFTPWKERPYCSIICDMCKEIVGHEYPFLGEIELEKPYRYNRDVIAPKYTCEGAQQNVLASLQQIEEQVDALAEFIMPKEPKVTEFPESEELEQFLRGEEEPPPPKPPKKKSNVKRRTRKSRRWEQILKKPQED